jgi:hypothetical protein
LPVSDLCSWFAGEPSLVTATKAVRADTLGLRIVASTRDGQWVLMLTPEATRRLPVVSAGEVAGRVFVGRLDQDLQIGLGEPYFGCR